jgi:hypothetical protein
LRRNYLIAAYELRYPERQCGGEAELEDRILRIAPRP